MSGIAYWKVFKIYNLYRLLLIIILLFNFKVDLSFLFFNLNGKVIFNLSIITYLLFICFFYVSSKRHNHHFETLIIFSSLVDLFFLNFLILCSSAFDPGIGVLLTIAIAALAIMLPGIKALFFAAFESILLLSYAYYNYSVFNNDLVYYAGLHGVGFFTTALTSLALANWIKSSHTLADNRKNEIISLQRLNEHIVKKMELAVVFVNAKRSVIFMNHAAKLIFSTEDKMPFSLQSLSQELDEVLQDYLLKSRQGESGISLKNNQQQVTILPYGGHEEDSMVIMIDDTKALMQKAQQLKLASLGRFTASIAHELRNPLSAILQASELLNESTGLSSQEKRFNQIISNNCNRMNELIKNILQLSRQEQSKAESVSLKDFILKFIKEYPRTQKICLIVINEHTNTDIIFDSSQLSQLLVILLDNAIMHGNDNHDESFLITLEINNTLDNGLILNIFDNGKGIPLENFNSIFEPFYSTSRQGIGLGLFIAKEICMANQATINLVDKKPLSGACFELKFSC